MLKNIYQCAYFVRYNDIISKNKLALKSFWCRVKIMNNKQPPSHRCAVSLLLLFIKWHQSNYQSLLSSIHFTLKNIHLYIKLWRLKNGVSIDLIFYLQVSESKWYGYNQNITWRPSGKSGLTPKTIKARIVRYAIIQSP